MDLSTETSTELDQSQEDNYNMREEHNHWKAERQKRQCQEFSEMAYWKQVSTCAAL